jgi:hypothetical protein
VLSRPNFAPLNGCCNNEKVSVYPLTGGVVGEFYCLPFEAQWLLYIPPGFTLKDSAFCPYNAFACFVWLSERTLIIFVKNSVSQTYLLADPFSLRKIAKDPHIPAHINIG